MNSDVLMSCTITLILLSPNTYPRSVIGSNSDQNWANFDWDLSNSDFQFYLNNGQKYLNLWIYFHMTYF